MAKPQQRVLDWNGKDMPKMFRSLPEGRYVIEAITPASEPTASEDAGLRRALDSVREGRTTAASVVHAELRGLVKPRRATRSNRSASSW